MTATEARRIRIDLPYRIPPLSLNQRPHWAEKASVTRGLRDTAYLLARHNKAPKGLTRVHIELHYQPARAGRRDSLNYMATLKPLIDGLVDYGLVVDDDSSHVTEAVIIEPVKKPAAVWIEITERYEPSGLDEFDPATSHNPGRQP